MRYLIGNDSRVTIAYLKKHISDLGMLLCPKPGLTFPDIPFACDNGVYSAWTKGKCWDNGMDTAYRTMLSKLPIDRKPLWVLLPDAVANWKRTLELGRLYYPLLRQIEVPVRLALQDGCDFEETLELEPDWVFVAGSTQWKESNIHAATEFFKPKGIYVHVGRVNTGRRLILCQSAGVDSVDGTTLNKFRDKTIGVIRDTLHQECLQL